MSDTELAGTELEEVPKQFNISYFTFTFHISLSKLLSLLHIAPMSGLQAFKLFDADGDGLVTTTELRSLIKKVYHMKMSINVLRFSRLAKQGIALVFWACVNENGICVNIEYVRFLNIVGNDFAPKWPLITHSS